jgi:DNA-binding MarR family transcriptional regulator
MTDEPLYKPENYSPDDSVAFLMGSVLSAMRDGLGLALQSHGDVTGAQWVMLMLIARGKCASASEIAHRMGYDSGSMTRMLDRLEAKGLIRRVRSTEDRRVVRLELAEAGEALAPQLPVVGARILNQFLRGFTAADLDQLKNYLRRMLANAPVDG